MAWDKRIVSMAEHLVHILGGTYATQGGVHSTSAGLSVKTKADITTATCQKYERHFANTSRWPHNLTPTKTRTVDMRESIASLPVYFNVEQDLRLITVRRGELVRELEMARQEQTRLQAQERASWLLRADITGQSLNEMEQMMKYREKLKAIRDILSDTPEGDRSLVIQRVKQLQTQQSQLPSDTQEFLRSLPPLVALES